MDDPDEDGYGSESWGEIDYRDLIAAADDVEKAAATPTKPAPPGQQLHQLWFTDADFDDFDDDDDNMAGAAVPGTVEVVDLTSSVETLRAGTPAAEVEEDAPAAEEEKTETATAAPAAAAAAVPRADPPPPAPPRALPPPPPTPTHPLRPPTKRKPSAPHLGRHPPPPPPPAPDARARRTVEYTGTVFPRLTHAYACDLAPAVAVAEFALRLMDVLTGVLRDFLVAHAGGYPAAWRQAKADEINRMVGHRKADALFRGWDFLALANCVITFRSAMPATVRNVAGVMERLRVLKTTMRWTFAHTSLQEEERKHPVEMSLWAINTLYLIENLDVSMEYAGRVLALHQGLWERERRPSPPPPPYVSQDS